jgi:(p)ppGpp synthase/HD superfamily hydrolase
MIHPMPDADEPRVVLGERFVAAVGLAVELHARQARKANGVPYVSHLLATAGLVLEHGGDEDLAIAALLHDGPEDQGGEATLARIRDRFGERVAGVVAACSDTFEAPKPPWRARKEAFLARLAEQNAAVWLVTLADKVHNARTLVVDARAAGPETFERFTGGRAGTLWYYGALADLLGACSPGPLATELAGLVAEMGRSAGR